MCGSMHQLEHGGLLVRHLIVGERFQPGAGYKRLAD
jgi:hypothetical protein